MAPPSSPNFHFLAAHDPLLVALGAQAERYFADDPVTCLMKLRQFGEVLAQLAAAHVGLPIPPRTSQSTLVEMLAAPHRGIINAETRDLFDGLRHKGNAATHGEVRGSHGSALHQLKMAHKLAIWFHRSFGKADFKPAPFIPPPDPAKESEQLKAELERLRRAVDEASLSAEAARAAAEEADRRKLAAEERAQRDAEEREVWQQLAEEAERKLVDALSAARKHAEAQPAAWLKKLTAHAFAASEKLELDEADTRNIIDGQLREAGWEVDSQHLSFERGTRPQAGRNLAIAEWPTQDGRADYVLFVGLDAVAVVEAKRHAKDVAGTIPQAQRYSRGFILHEEARLAGGPWGEYRVPFLFATNGRPYLEQLQEKSGIWFLDVRLATNHPRALVGWHSPEGLREMLRQDVEKAEAALRAEPTEDLGLRGYQVEAIRAVEQALEKGARRCLVAMATGTGKTRTFIGLIYRLVKTGRFRRVLFLVDRTALGTQAMDAFKTGVVDGVKTFADIYNIKELKELKPEPETKLHFSTVQAMVRRVLASGDGAERPTVSDYDCIVVDECHRGYTLDREMSDEELTFRSQDDYLSQYRRVLDYFDSVKVGLTATPALHTTHIFGSPVYRYGYREAVIDGWLVDHEPPIRIETELSRKGIRWEVGEEVQAYDAVTKQLDLITLPDELSFEVESFNRQVITEGFNRVVAEQLVKQIDPSLEGKTLVFCVNEDHAVRFVRLLKEALDAQYGPQHDDTVMKITGASDKYLELILRYKNEPRLPSIAVTVDLLTTGIDVPPITNLVFLRRVKSRILYEQMIGRATRLHTFSDGSAKEFFRIFDAVDLYAGLEKFSDMKPVVANPSIPFTQLVEDLCKLPDGEARKNVHEQLLAKLQRKKRAFRDDKKAELFEAAAGQPLTGTLQHLRSCTPSEAAVWFTAHSQVPELLDRVTGGGQKIYLHRGPDVLLDVTHGYGENRQRPQDYLDGFAQFLRENANKLPALKVVTTRPRELTRQSLKELKLALDAAGYTETALQTAWRDVTNEDIAATLIGFIRQRSLGEPLVPYAERVDKAVKRVLSSRPWTPPQRKWLELIGKQLKANAVVDRESFDSGAFKDKGGYSGIDKVFDGRLEQVLGELTDSLWQNAS